MAGSIIGFKDCPVIVCSVDNVCIAEAIITSHDKMHSIIEISEILDNLENGTRLNILIVHKSGVSEYSGTLRYTHTKDQEIALFNPQHRSARGAPRHKLNSPATINSLVIESGRKPFSPPLLITVANISRTGTLLKCPPGHFKIGSVLELHINIRGRDAILYPAVVRECKDSEKLMGFGCKFLFPFE